MSGYYQEDGECLRSPYLELSGDWRVCSWQMADGELVLWVRRPFELSLLSDIATLHNYFNLLTIHVYRSDNNEWLTE